MTSRSEYSFNPSITYLVHGYLFSDHIDVALLFWIELSIWLLLRGLREGSTRWLIAAVEQVFPAALRQRCLAHKMRNLETKVPAERWGDAMAALVDEVRAGRPGEGMAAAVGQIGTILAETFPKTDADTNELPDRLIEL